MRRTSTVARCIGLSVFHQHDEQCFPGERFGPTSGVSHCESRVFVSFAFSRTKCMGARDWRHEPFKFFVHGIGEGRKPGETLVFTRATTGDEGVFKGYGKSFEQELTEKDPVAHFDAERFSIISKVSCRSHGTVEQNVYDIPHFTRCRPRTNISLLGIASCSDVECRGHIVEHVGVWEPDIRRKPYSRPQNADLMWFVEHVTP